MAKPKVQLPKKIRNTKPMDWRWVDYHYAQYKVQSLDLKSAREYWKWYKECQPAGFPLRPERIYSEWESWNKFLGGDNQYLADIPTAVREKDLMPYWEAVNLIQPMQLQTIEEYRQAFDDGLIPKGIPRMPHLRYPSFYAWGGYRNWLGKNIKHRIEATKNIDPLMVLYSTSEQSPNMLSVLIHTKGATSLMNELKEQPIKVVKIYHWYPDFAEHVFAMLNSFGTKQGDNTWLFSNVHEVLFELSGVLEVFNPS